MNFESWRDFSLEGEHDVEDAHDRYEKRWMIKENERKAKVRDCVLLRQVCTSTLSYAPLPTTSVVRVLIIE